MERRRLYRDGALAAGTCVGLLLGWAALGLDAGALATPRSAAVGCVGMVALEVVLLRRPALTRRLWERPAVRAGSVLGVLAGGGLAAWLGAVWVGAVLIWGLAAYVLLVGAVAALGRNPLTQLA
jgi:hypothetical protein